MCVACGHKYPWPTQRSRATGPQPVGRYRIKPLRRPVAQQPTPQVAPAAQPVAPSVPETPVTPKGDA